MVLTEVLAEICMSAGLRTQLYAQQGGWVQGRATRSKTNSAPEQGRAGLAARNRDDRRQHEVLDEGARDDDLDGRPLAGLDCCAKRADKRRASGVGGGVGGRVIVAVADGI